jgi:sortase system peptidoglycan-associated protein
MKLKPLIAAIALAGVTHAASAAEPSVNTPVEHKRGAVTGLVVGAIAGGPFGAFAGTVLGAEVFGRLFEQRRVVGELDVEINRLHAQISSEKTSRSATIAQLNRDLDKLLALQSSTAKSLRLPVQFRTGSADLESQYETELLNIARVLKRNKDARVNLTGFADRRGEDKYNQSLSEDRVTVVQRYLLRQGVSHKQILSIAYGETQPLNPVESFETNFFDRRVLVELNMDIDPQLATR